MAGSDDPTSVVLAPLSFDDKGQVEAPKQIFQSVEASRSLYMFLRQEHLDRIALCAIIEGLISGNPPYDPDDLSAQGISYVSNFNNLDGRSLFERGALAYWNLFNQAQTLIKFELYPFDPKYQNDPALTDYANIMARHWTTVVRKWESFYTQVNTLVSQLLKFGISPVFWPDERNWKWETIEYTRFFVPNQTVSDISKLTVAFIESEYTLQYLFDIYDEFKNREDESPWDIEALGRYLVHRSNEYFASQGWDAVDNIMSLQLMLQNNDIGFDKLYRDTVKLVSHFAKEYSGKISHYIFDRFWTVGDYLFKVDEQYDSILKALIIFTASPGEFTLHSNRGLGHKILSISEAIMQMDCSLVDMVKWSSTPFLKGLSVGQRDMEPIKWTPGVPTYIGASEFQQNNLGSNISQLVSASQYLSSKVQFNTANSGDDPGVPDRNQGSISNTQAKMMSYREFGILKHNIAHFYSYLDRVYTNMVVAMLKSTESDPGYEEAKYWKDCCIQDGVPKEMFKVDDTDPWGVPRQFKEIKASRVAGDGSNVALLMGLQEMQQIAGGFGPNEAKEYKRLYITATMGADYIPTFMQDADDEDETAGGASLAAVENAVIQMGKSPVFSMDNEHRSHAVTHMALGSEIIQRIQQQQMTPIEADKVFELLLPHTSEHLQALADNPFARSFMSQVEGPWKQISEYARLNKKNAGAMLQKQLRDQEQNMQKQQEAMSDEARKDMIAKRTEDRKDAQAMSKEQRADEQSQTRAELERENVENKASNERLAISLKAGNESKKAQMDAIAKTREQIRDMNGVTPAPHDIEGIKKI